MDTIATIEAPSPGTPEAAAQAELEQIRGEREDLQKQLAAVDTIRGRIAVLNAREAKLVRFLAVETPPPPRAPRQPRVDGISPLQIADAVRAVLTDAGGPVKTPELVTALAGRGVTVPGTPETQAARLSGILSRTGGFVANRAKGWTLAEPTAVAVEVPLPAEAAE